MSVLSKVVFGVAAVVVARKVYCNAYNSAYEEVLKNYNPTESAKREYEEKLRNLNKLNNLR